MSFVAVYRAADRTEAHLLKGLLEQHGITVRLFGEGLSSAFGELPAEVLEVELLVPAGFRQLARELIGEYEQVHKNDVSSSWQCPFCDEINPQNFGVCWRCGNPGPA